MNYWLMKSEPSTYSIDDLARDKTTFWEGVRNFQARNHLHKMKKGDLILFYHSSIKPAVVAGVARVSRKAYPDETQFDKKSDYYDPSSKKEKPKWYRVDVEFVKKFSKLISIDKIRKDARFADMVLLRASRLSVQPVSKIHFELILNESR